VVGVLALRHVGTKVGFSDLGPEIGISAPGGNCVNTAANSACLYPILTATDSGTQGPVGAGWTDSYAASLGTSFSSPLVAGVAALMLSAHPTLTPDQLRTVMQATARPFPTTGADPAADGSPITQCVPPVSGVQQQQCYCTTALCGAGMLDAGAAVAAVASVVARITVATASPTAGSPVQLDSAGSAAGSGRRIVTWNWVLVNGGGIVSGFSSASNAATAAFTPSAAGTVTVRLTVTDDLGLSADTQSTVTVAAAPATATTSPPPTTAAAGSGGGGGGALSAPWLLALAAAVLWLRAGRRG
jgi:serine protease